MSLPRRELLYTPEEYLEMERASETRHEYIDGYIYEMAGESLSHSRLCISIAAEVRNALRGTPCEALSPNMKVRTGDARTFSYPDLSVVCGEPLFHDKHKDVLLNAVAIFEVLSPSTEKHDRGEKFMRYRNFIESLTDYVLITQHAPIVEHFARQQNGGWLMQTYTGLDATFVLPNINCEIALRDLYERVVFPPVEHGDEDSETNDSKEN
jgi:Uma2 family endonuclease